jgi:hypothetical protein
MIEREPHKTKVTQLAAAASDRESLPYRVELWSDGDRKSLERVLARAFSAPLARAIFKAAQTEHPGRRITLRRGARVIADTTE